MKRDPFAAANSMLGGSHQVEPHPCEHGVPIYDAAWSGVEGTTGSIAVIGAGKIGLPLAVHYARHGWQVSAVDINESLVETINRGIAPWEGEEGLAEGLREAIDAGRLRATTDGIAAVSQADIAMIIVPVLVNEDGSLADRALHAASATITAGAHDDLLLIVETTVPVGTTRALVERVATASGKRIHGAFSPERVLTGETFRNLAAYPKLVGGVDQESTKRAMAFYHSVIDAPVAEMGSIEAAEMAKLAETTYRDVNIALANEFARVADRHGVDLSEVIRAANSQPYSHIHEPGIGVGGHCIPVYPRMLLLTDPDLALIRTARSVNDHQAEVAVNAAESRVGSLAGSRVLVLGLTYREGVKELAHARGPVVAEILRARGATVYAHDSLLSDAEIARLGLHAWDGREILKDVQVAIVTTGDQAYRGLDAAGLLPDLRVLVDGRNTCTAAHLPAGAERVGFGRPNGVDR